MFSTIYHFITGSGSTGICWDRLTGVGIEETWLPRSNIIMLVTFVGSSAIEDLPLFRRDSQALYLDMWPWDSYLDTLASLFCKNKMRQLSFMLSQGPSNSKTLRFSNVISLAVSFLILRRGVKVSEGQDRNASPCSFQAAELSELGGWV